ncbi:MAG: hypothetical protein IIZ25_05420 [Thermoguttaceae bacterium]|nr:hypothetical protein [Thermoguttaceae bacterium]
MRWATVCLFTVFAAVSFYKAITGEASCGCFGEVKVHPLLTTILDVAIAAASWLSRLKTAESKGSGAWMLGAVKAFAALLVIICSQALLFGGSIIGNGASFDRKDLTFSIARPDDSAEDSLNIAITNNAEEALTISGVKGNCSSGGNIRGIPVTIRPGESASVVYVATDREHQDQRAKQKQRFTLHIGTDHIQKMRVELPLYRKLIKHQVGVQNNQNKENHDEEEN